jgi:predicted ArsR family transcriptional regulator
LTGSGPDVEVELAPVEAAGQHVALAGIAPGRRAVLERLKVAGEATAEQLAAELGVTVGAVRQHLKPLAADGLVGFHDEPVGPGRPRRRWSLTAAAEALWPKRYGQLTNQLLGFVAQTDRALIDDVFVRRRDQRVEQARARLAGRSFSGQVAELAQILDEDGYLADCVELEEGHFLVTERNCAILDVARQFPVACSSELAFLRAAMPEASIERVSHILAGAHSCAYDIRRAGARRPGRGG